MPIKYITIPLSFKILVLVDEYNPTQFGDGVAGIGNGDGNGCGYGYGYGDGNGYGDGDGDGYGHEYGNLEGDGGSAD
jgi:hypothetical protein